MIGSINVLILNLRRWGRLCHELWLLRKGGGIRPPGEFVHVSLCRIQHTQEKGWDRNSKEGERRQSKTYNKNSVLYCEGTERGASHSHYMLISWLSHQEVALLQKSRLGNISSHATFFFFFFFKYTLGNFLWHEKRHDLLVLSKTVTLTTKYLQSHLDMFGSPLLFLSRQVSPFLQSFLHHVIVPSSILFLSN